MGYSTAIAQQAGSGRWAVTVSVHLSRTETNDLFLSGDSMVSWPVEGLVHSVEGEAMPERSSMFVSEIAALPEGLPIFYAEQSQAERAATLIRTQFAQAGIEEEV